VRENAGKMGTLIEDLLAFSRLGRKPIAPVEMDMDALVAEVVREIQSSLADTRTVIETAKLPPAQGDRAMVRQVWINLLSNAMKFSGKSDHPKVEIGASRQGTEDIYWVKDSGIGFDMQYYGKLFGVFQRLHSAEEFPGTGVGLAIVQRVVTRHGGRVWADSKPGAGATFYFTLQPS
jgi:light-regulated signal transduction histidine kinase (bacteriophytochrome)